MSEAYSPPVLHGELVCENLQRQQVATRIYELTKFARYRQLDISPGQFTDMPVPITDAVVIDEGTHPKAVRIKGRPGLHTPANRNIGVIIEHQASDAYFVVDVQTCAGQEYNTANNEDEADWFSEISLIVDPTKPYDFALVKANEKGMELDQLELTVAKRLLDQVHLALSARAEQGQIDDEIVQMEDALGPIYDPNSSFRITITIPAATDLANAEGDIADEMVGWTSRANDSAYHLLQLLQVTTADTA